MRGWNICSISRFELRFRYTHPWRESDLLVWNALEAIHRAIADYGPDEIRLMRARQVLATKTFDLYSCARCAN